MPLQLIVISTHFCVAAWVYESVMKFSGKWNQPISQGEIHRLMDAGGILVDVRDAHEFAQGHLPNAINIPLDELVLHLETFQKQPALLYCQSGARCQQGVGRLKRHGVDQVYNLGAMERWEEGA